MHKIKIITLLETILHILKKGKIMLTTTLDLAEKYDYLSEKFEKAYEFLKTQDLNTLPVGTIEIDGRDIFASVQEYDTVPWDQIPFEAHNKYFDIQYIVSGRELFGYAKRGSLKETAPYNDSYDVILFHEPESCSRILLEAGDFAIVPPEDAHKPKCMADRKSVV